jgi:uncharacterized protein YoxC
VTAGVLADAGLLLGSVALIIFAVAIAVAIIRRQFSSLSADLHGVKLTAEAVNRAVNNVPHGEPSLLDRVGQLHSKVDSFMAETDDWRVTVDDRLVRIEDYLTNPPGGRRKAS